MRAFVFRYAHIHLSQTSKHERFSKNLETYTSSTCSPQSIMDYRASQLLRASRTPCRQKCTEKALERALSSASFVELEAADNCDVHLFQVDSDSKILIGLGKFSPNQALSKQNLISYRIFNELH